MVKTKSQSKPPGRNDVVNAKPTSPQQKINQLVKDLLGSLIERDEEVYLTATAVVGRVSVLLVGPPGCAKSFALESFVRAISGASYFYWLMGRFTEPDEIFGPVDVLSLKQGKRKRLTARKLPEAHFAFLDEFWKSSTAIAGTLLRITNERVFDDGEGERKVPLQTLFAASNEYPQDGELGAMFDRFVLRKEVSYVNEQSSRSTLLRSMDHTPKTSVTLSLEELDTAHAEAMALPVPDQTWAKAEEILETVIRDGAWRPSDRRLPLVGKVIRAFAYVCGSSEVKVSHLKILKHMLWNDPQEQPKALAKIVDKIANPVGMEINRLVEQAKSVRKSNPPGPEVSKKLEEIRDLFNRLPQDNVHVQKMQTWLENEIGDNAKIFAGID